MPPRVNSRYQYTIGLTDAEGRLFLSDRVKFLFKRFDDNRSHVVRDGDTLQNLAAFYFQGFKRPAGLWWIIADFQLDPIFDPTITLEVGSVIVVPSMRTVQTQIFSERRRGL